MQYTDRIDLLTNDENSDELFAANSYFPSKIRNNAIIYNAIDEVGVSYLQNSSLVLFNIISLSKILFLAFNSNWLLYFHIFNFNNYHNSLYDSMDSVQMYTTKQ